MSAASDEASPVVLITGASSGFGRATASRLADDGMRVYGTSRRASADEDRAYEMLAMDVTDDAGVRDGVARVLAEAGRIDVVVNNAGISIGGAIEDTSIAEAKRQLDTNFFGAVRVIHAVLPHMRERGAGTIINISSIGGLISLPFQGFYSASKFAIEGLTEALRMEVASFGVRVVAIEPGDFKTEMTANRIIAERADRGAYAQQFRRTLDVYANDEQSGSDPRMIAELVARIIAEPSPKLRYLVGMPGQKAAAMLKRIAGSRLFERLMRQHCRIE